MMLGMNYRRSVRAAMAWLHVGVGGFPGWATDASALGNVTTLVDQLRRDRALVATLFVREGDDLVRITTSILKPDGHRATGTRLDHSHPAYRATCAGQPYEGYALIFEQRYYTRYEPLRDASGQLLGALFVGQDLSERREPSVAGGVARAGACAAFVVTLGLAQGGLWGTTPSALWMQVLGAAVAAAAVGLTTYAMVQRRIAVPLRAARNAALALARGDLREQLHVASSDEAGQVLLAFNLINVGLAKLVGEVHTLAQTVVDGVREIAAGNQDLSQRTETQASALQQAAGSMEHLEQAVHHNTAQSGEADQLAQTASGVATQGGQTVSQVVTTMRDIQSASGRIADIIAVIDSIAFQTNILALNAAVEAARAGEQGKGFAVVASEVRALAGRTAQAAKEIKDLISANLQSVERGADQVEQAGTTMQDVVDQISRLASIAAEISTASRDQSGNVNQVGTAVAQIDQATQQNAALVEQISAAANSLTAKAHELIMAVGAFKLR